MAGTRTLRAIDTDLADQVRLRGECTTRIAQLSDRVIHCTREIDALLAERSQLVHTQQADVLRAAANVLTRAAEQEV